MTKEIVRVGARSVGLDEARSWLLAYFDAEENRTAKRPYAYPAYDYLDTGSGPNQLNDGDLLAPGMLNVPIKVSGLYALQSARESLELGLRGTPENVTLGEAVDDGTLARRLTEMIGVLDRRKLATIKLTTLTKVLHRKRPRFVPLHDKFVKNCYYGADHHPVKPQKGRTWVGYFTAIATAIDRDVREQEDELVKLRADTGTDVSLLRLIDVIAWKLGKK